MNISEFMDKMLSVFPDGQWDIDDDGQVIVYTGIQHLTLLDNPSIPEGEVNA